MKLFLNMAECNKCKQVLISSHRHDFRACVCGAMSVDGGIDYIKRMGDINDINELSIIEENGKFKKLKVK